MKKKLLILLLAVTSLSAMAQTYHGHFLKKITATGYGPAQFKCVAYDKRGNLYAAGGFKDTALFDNGTKLVSTEGSEDIIIAKFDRKGKTIWAKKAGGKQDIESAHDIAVDSNNNVYVVGFAQAKAKFDNFLINQDTATGEHGFLAKLDSNGKYQWVKGGLAFEYNSYTAKQTSLYVDKNNNLFFGGSITNQVVKLPYFDSLTFTNIGCCNSNVFLWKMDANGKLLARFEPALNFDFITGITGDSKGNIIVVGAYTSDTAADRALQIVAGTPIKNAKGIYGTAYNSGYTLKLDNNLKTLWIKPNWGTTNSVLNGLAVDSLDNIYVGGTYGDTLQIGNTKLITGEHSNNIYYAKYNSAGNFQWAKSYGAFTEYGYDAYKLAYDKSNDKLWATIHTITYPIVFSGININHNLAICEMNKTNGAITNIIQNTTDPEVKAVGLAVWKKNVAVVGSYLTGFPGQDSAVAILGLKAPITYNEPEDAFIFEFTDTTTLPLPVGIVAVKAYAKQGGINVEWTSEKETNIAYYEVEKSLNGISFNRIATVKATNTNSIFTYSNMDDALIGSANLYYRIKIVRKDGIVKYTPVVSVSTANRATIKVYPNPVTNNTFSLLLTNVEKGSYNLSITNSLGRNILMQPINHQGGSANERIVLPATAKGIYFVQLNNAKGSVYTQQLLIQ